MLKKSNNLFKSNKTINFNKKLIFNSHVYVSYDTYDSPIRYNSYDMHQCIERFMSTNDMPLWYETFCTRYNTYHTICTIYQYDTIHTIRTYVSDDSWALMIYLYDTKLFVHDTIHIAYLTILTIMLRTKLTQLKG